MTRQTRLMDVTLGMFKANISYLEMFKEHCPTAYAMK